MCNAYSHDKQGFPGVQSWTLANSVNLRLPAVLNRIEFPLDLLLFDQSFYYCIIWSFYYNISNSIILNTPYLELILNPWTQINPGYRQCYYGRNTASQHHRNCSQGIWQDDYLTAEKCDHGSESKVRLNLDLLLQMQKATSCWFLLIWIELRYYFQKFDANSARSQTLFLDSLESLR